MPSTRIGWPEAGIPMSSRCREPVTTHRVATVSPLPMMSCRSSFRSGELALKPATFCLKPASDGSSPGAGLWSTRPGSHSSSIAAWSAARNACSKRVMISVLADKASPLSVGADGVAYAAPVSTDTALGGNWAALAAPRLHPHPGLGVQPRADPGGQEVEVGRYALGTAGAVPPDAGDHRELGRPQVRQLRLVVRHPEVQVGGARHEEHPGADRGQRPRQVAAVLLAGADVRLLPGERLRVQVRGPVRGELLLPVGAQEAGQVRRVE